MQPLRAALFLSFLLLLFLPGCSMPVFGPYYEEKVRELATLLDPLNGGTFFIQLPGDGENVTLFACRKVQPSNVFERVLQSLFDPGFVGGECGFFTLDNTTMEVLKNGELIPRATDIGFGNTILEFHEASRLCNNSPRYAISYIYGASQGFLVPQKSLLVSSQTCLAAHSIIPVYVFVGRGGLVPVVSNEGDIATRLSANPSLVIYMHNTKESNFALLRQRLDIIHANCPRCIVGLGVTFNDLEYLGRVSNTSVMDAVDFISFGVDTRYSNQTTGEGLFGETLTFFGAVRGATGKPVFIHYTYLENLTDYEARIFYSKMFSALRMLGPMGLLGYVPEPFYDRSSFTGKPATGLVSTTGTEWQKKFSMVFSQCRLYYALRPSLTFFSPSGMMAYPWALPSEPADLTPSFSLPSEEGEPPYLITLADKDKFLYDCNTCIGSATANYYTSQGIHPFSVGDATCEEAKQREGLYASRLFFDPAAIMALSLMATSQCDISVLPPSYVQCDFPTKASIIQQYTSCNLPQYRASGITCSLSGSGEECYICHYGPLMLPYPPGPFAPSYVRAVCGEDFDPFDREDAACGAAVAFSKYYDEYNRQLAPRASLYYMDGEAYEPSLLAITALRYFTDERTVDKFLSLVSEIGGASDCAYLSYTAQEFCCDGGDMVNPICGKQLDPAAVIIKLHTTYPSTAGAQEWRFLTKKTYDYLVSYTSIVNNCHVCDKEKALQNFCEKAKEQTGEDVCANAGISP